MTEMMEGTLNADSTSRVTPETPPPALLIDPNALRAAVNAEIAKDGWFYACCTEVLHLLP